MSLYVVKAMGGGNVFITKGEFEEPLESVLESCGRLVQTQGYVRKFDIHRGESIDVNLDNFRKNTHLYRTTLLEVICRSQGLSLTAPTKAWLDVPPHSGFADKIVIHRRTSVVRERGNPQFDWDRLLENVGSKNCVFVSRLESEWREFNRPEIEYYRPADIYEHAQAIRACRLYIGNQSLPSALADALAVDRIFELSCGIDRKHFAVTYANNAWYFASPWDYTLKNFRYLSNGGALFRDLVTNKMTDSIEPYPFDWKKALASELGCRSEYSRAVVKQHLMKFMGKSRASS